MDSYKFRGEKQMERQNLRHLYRLRQEGYPGAAAGLVRENGETVGGLTKKLLEERTGIKLT